MSNVLVTLAWISNYIAQYHVDGLAQDCSNSIALAMELLQSCTKPSMCDVVQAQETVVDFIIKVPSHEYRIFPYQDENTGLGLSYLHNVNPCIWKDGLYCEMFVTQMSSCETVSVLLICDTQKP